MNGHPIFSFPSRRGKSLSPRRERVVSLFAEEQGIAPGIVVGMLQHNGFFPWTHLNALKVRLDWKS